MNKKSLITLPTPLDFFGNINSNKLYIKRDDLTDLALGGNKARKLEYFIADALKNGADCIVTYGAAQSNHCRITAAVAARFNLKCVLILAEEEHPTYTGNYFLSMMLGVDIRWTAISSVPESIERTMNEMKSQGFTPYFIQGGGHGNLGTHAYVEAYRELCKQLDDIDYIFHASGTGTTQAGLVAGAAIENADVKIIGISVARNEQRCKEVVVGSINDYADFQAISLSHLEEKILIEDAYVGKGYADIYPDVLDTIQHVARTASIFLDPVYTGKAFYGMLQYIEKHQIQNKNIVFIHTGGLPLLFHYSEQFKGIDL